MAEDAWYQMDLTAQEVQEIKSLLGLDQEYALTVGNLLYFLAYSSYSDWGTVSYTHLSTYKSRMMSSTAMPWRRPVSSFSSMIRSPFVIFLISQ